MIKVFRDIHASGKGFSGFYEPVAAALASRLSHLFVRNIIYKTIYDQTKPFKPSSNN